MFRNYILIGGILLFFGQLPAQENDLLWQKTIGGTGEDEIASMVTDAEGHIYTLGSIQVNDPFANMDIHLTKQNSNGQLIWEKKIHGNYDDRGVSLLINQQQEVVVLTYSNSTTGIFQSNYGDMDIYLFRFTSGGVLLGHQHYGGSGIDLPSDIIENVNGSYIISATSLSNSHDFDVNNGQKDLWLLNVANDGSILWKNHFGGEDEDCAKALTLDDEGNIYLLANSTSYAMYFTDNYGDFDINITKCDENGNVIWVKNYGGSGADFGTDIIARDQDKLIVSGNTYSANFDVSHNNGFSDAWIFEVNCHDGTLNWEQTFGESGSEIATSMFPNGNGSIMIAGTTNSTSLNGITTHGKLDIWVAQLEGKELIQCAVIGESGFDDVHAIHEDSHGNLILAGTTNSTDGIVNTPQGKVDGWLLKIRPSKLFEFDVSTHPNPVSSSLYINGLLLGDELTMYTHSGQIVRETQRAKAFSSTYDVSDLTAGVYLLHIRRGSQVVTRKMVKI